MEQFSVLAFQIRLEISQYLLKKKKKSKETERNHKKANKAKQNSIETSSTIHFSLEEKQNKTKKTVHQQMIVTLLKVLLDDTTGIDTT